MILKIRKLLGLDDKQTKIERFSEVYKSLNDLNKEIDILAEDFTVKNENFKQILKSKEVDSEIKKSIQTKYDNFLKIHRENIQDVVKQRKKLKKEYDSILKDKEISKAVKDIEFFDNLKEKYKGGEISSKEYDLVIKAKTGKVKYSDILVFNKDGKLLLLQRDKDDNNGGKWGIVGGHVDNGEEFIDAAQRELQEETGIYVDTDCLKEVGIYDKDGVEIHYFELNLKDDKEIVIQNKEGQDYKWIDIFSDLDKYEMPFDMKDNIIKIMGLSKENKIILKAVKSGMISIELGEKLLNKSKEIKELYRKRGVTPPEGKGIHTKEFHDLASKLMQEGMDKDVAYATAMKKLGRDRAVKKEHWDNDVEKSWPEDKHYPNETKEEYEKHEAKESKETEEREHKKGGYEYKQARSKEEFKEKEYLGKMIEEHERLVKVLTPFAESSDSVKKELEYQAKELKRFKEKLAKIEKEGLDAVKKDDEEISKARTGVYADNAVNRRLKRVGQRYGSPSNNYENENNQPSNNLKENAKNSSDEALRTALKESPDEEVRQAAKEELERRKEDNYGDDYNSKLGSIEKEIISLRRKMSEEEDLGKVEEYNNKMLQLMEDRKNFIKENKSSSNSQDSYGKRIKDIENNILVLKKRLSSEDDLDKIEKYNNDLNKLIEDRRKLKDKYEESKKQGDKVLNIENQILGLRERMSKESDLEKIEQYNDKLLKLIDERKGLLGDKGIEKAEEIIGGLGDNKTVKDIAKKHGVSEEHISKQLEMGIKVEMEHTNDKSKSREIALDHLMESPDYYTKLEKMEESFEDREKK